jgi:hypothetical protein
MSDTIVECLSISKYVNLCNFAKINCVFMERVEQSRHKYGRTDISMLIVNTL